MVHPATELRFISDAIGFGVFATSFIPKGTIVWALDPMDSVITPEKYNELCRTNNYYKEQLDKYSYIDQNGCYVLCWDIARFFNHSFMPTCLGTPFGYEIAVRDILPGEELTDDYGTLNLEENFEAFPEEGSARKVVTPYDFELFGDEWDRQLAEVFPYLAKVAQPLSGILTEEIWKESLAASSDTSRLMSVKVLAVKREKLRV
jgi:SET domain-containing protein